MQIKNKLWKAIALGVAYLLLLSWAYSAHAQTVFPNRGGTGLSTPPSYGQVLVGNSSGGYTLTATSSLGISGGGGGSAAWGGITGTLSDQSDLIAALNAKLATSAFGSLFYSFFHATNTDALPEGSTNKYWSPTLFDNRLSATTTLPSITSLPSLSLPYSQLTGKPTIPTKTSDLTNDSGFITDLSSFNTGNLAEGSNLYYTTTRFDNRLSATTSLPNITSLTNLGTVKTSLSGILKASSGVLSAAVSNTDYQAPITLTTTGTSGAATFNGTTLNIPQYSGTSGTVTSVGLTVPTGLSVSGSPVTTSGTLAVSLTAGYVIPLSASTTDWNTAYLNRITSANSPLSISSNAISLGTVTVAKGGTGQTSLTSSQLLYGNGTNALSSVATTSVTCTGIATCSGFTAIGSSPITISVPSGGGSGIGSSTASGSWTPGNVAVVHDNGSVYAIGTSTPALASEISYSGTLGSFVGGSSGTLSLTANGVALTKLATIGANTILGNNTGATGNVVAIATSSLGIAISDTTGTLTVSRGGTGVASLTGDQFLYTNHAGTAVLTAASSSLNLPNSALANSTISGIALGSNLAALSATDSTLTFSGSYTGATARTVGLNLGNANTWTALQKFSAAASTTQLSVFGKAYFGGTATSTFDSAGNLFVAGTASTSANASFGSGPQSFEIRQNNSNTSTAYPYVRIDSGGDLVFEPGSSGTLYLNYDHGASLKTSINGDQVIVLGNGNVGIGTTTPYAGLSIGNKNLVIGSNTAGGSVGDLYLPKLGTPAGTILAADATGKIIATTTPSGGGGITAFGAQYSTAQTGATQTVASSTSGTDFSITSSGNTTTFNLPSASASNRGLLTATDWSTFNSKLSSAITAIGPAGQTQTGATQTLATSTDTSTGLTLGLTITASGNVQTFAPTLSGTLNVANGGTGRATFTSSQLIYGNGTTGLSSVATATPSAGDGIAISGSGAIVGTSLTINNPFAIATSSSGLAVSQLAYFTKTSGKTTIGGVATSSLATDSSITSSGTLGAQIGGSNTTLSLNMANANSWTALQTFANSSTTLGSFATELTLPYSTAPTLTANGDIGIDSTANQLKYKSGGATRVLMSELSRSFTYATSSWTGTTTIPLDAVINPYTFTKISCFTDAGTVDVDFFDGTNRTNLVVASTTNGITTLTANNDMTAGKKVNAELGTPASSPTKIVCTAAYTFDAQ